MKPRTVVELVALVAIVGLAVWLLPLLLIWALNVLFSEAIPYDFWHWLAALVLGGFMSSGGGSKR